MLFRVAFEFHNFRSWFYAVVMGNTLRSIRLSEDASVCKTLDQSLHEGKKYTIFDFTYSIFVVVGTLNFNLKATIQFTSGMYVEFFVRTTEV